MIEKIADDLIGQMTEARLIDKEMEARYVYVFICWIEKFITVGSIIVISLMFHKLLPTIFFLVFFLELRKRTGGYHLDKFYRCYLASIVSYLVIVIISRKIVRTSTMVICNSTTCYNRDRIDWYSESS